MPLLQFTVEGCRSANPFVPLLCLAGILAAFFLGACQSAPVRPDPGATLPSAQSYVQPVEEEMEEPSRLVPLRPGVVPHSYREVAVAGRFVALTFDDGPSARQTPLLLDMLKERGISATFFVVGQRAAAHPWILRRMVMEGHEVANHTWSHPDLTQLSGSAVRNQIVMTNSSIQAAIGYEPVLVRPPYGATNAELNRWMTEDMGLKVILWSVDSRDWQHRDPLRVQREITSRTRPGAIILAHDIHATTVAAMPATLDQLLSQGYRFVTVSQLIAMESGRDAVGDSGRSTTWAD
jgi:peptidoglycan-N-acetylglucosamine deacetylase